MKRGLEARANSTRLEHPRLRAFKERDSALSVAIKCGIVMRGLANIEKSGWVELNGSVDQTHDTDTSKTERPSTPHYR